MSQDSCPGLIFSGEDMNQNEIKEIRRRFKIEGNAIYRIYGCYVNANKEIISTFETTPGFIPEEEEDMYLKLFKKVLSGTFAKNLMDIEFTTQQVEDSPEHGLLMRLKDSGLKDEEARKELCQKIIENFNPDDKNYLILMAHDTYDVSYKDKNDEEVFDGGGEMFRYFITAVCPVKDPKKILSYNNDNGAFAQANTGQIASNPEIGFMFPAFNDRSSDIYHTMYYTRSAEDIQEDVIDALFKSDIPVSAPVQKFMFTDAMESALDKDLSFDVVQTVHEKMREAVELHKEIKDPEPLGMSIDEAADILKDSGLEKEKIDRFAKAVEERMGEDAVLRPSNLMDTKKFEISTSEVKIRVSPEASSMIRAKVIDGRRYILIPADAGIEVNGIEINIPLEED